MLSDNNQNSESENIEKKINTLKSLSIDKMDNFKQGLYVDALDDAKTWCLAQIIERKGDIIKVHYDGWSSKFDEVK